MGDYRDTVETKLLEIFDRLKKPSKPLELDPYQTIRPYPWEPDLWRENLLNRRYPQIHPPPGSLVFGSDGTIIHNFLAGTQ